MHLLYEVVYSICLCRHRILMNVTVYVRVCVVGKVFEIETVFVLLYCFCLCIYRL